MVEVLSTAVGARVILYVFSRACVKRRQRGRVVRAPDLKSGDPEFKSRSKH